MSEQEKVLSKRKRKAQESWATKKSDKKPKVIQEIDEDAAINPAVGEPPKKKKPKVVNPETKEEGEEEGKATEEPKKKRFTLFVGNLSFKTTVEDLQAHIKPTGITPQSVRLQTDSVTKKPKGFAFIDLTNAQALDKVLNLHHTTLGGRKINVELTAGGGGSGEKRKAKIAKKNEKLDVERETAQKTKRDADAKKVRGPRPDSKAAKQDKEKRDLEMNEVNPARRKRIS